MIKFKNKAVADVFSYYPETVNKKLLTLRTLIFEVAAEIKEVGELEETLKWGEPSYLTSETGAGSTIRIHWQVSRPDEYTMYFNCKTTLIAAFKERYPDSFQYGGNRSIIFNMNDNINGEDLKDCIAMALTYHLRKSN